MTRYAIKDGLNVLRVVTQDNPPAVEHEVITPGQTMPARPHGSTQLRIANGTLFWFDTRTLAEAKRQRLTAMRDAREAAIHGGFTVGGAEFQSNALSQIRLTELKIAAAAPGFTTRRWRLANNNWRVLNAAESAAVWAAMDSHIQAQFTTFGQREAAIAAASSIAEVGAVTW